MSLEEKRNLIKNSEHHVVYGHSSARRALEVSMATHRGNGILLPNFVHSNSVPTLAQHKRMRDRKSQQLRHGNLAT